MEATQQQAAKRASVESTQNNSQWRAGKMRSYYTQLAPLHYVCQWLMRQGQAILSDYEIALFRGAENAVVQRHGHFVSAEHLREAFNSGVAEKIDIGPQAPGGNSHLARSLLAFDLDADDYDQVYASPHAAGALQENLGVMRPEIWRVLVLSARLLDHYLRYCVFQQFAKKPSAAAAAAEEVATSEPLDAMDMDTPNGDNADEASLPPPDYSSMAVFSGRRGIHLWIFDHFRDAFNAEEILELLQKIRDLRTALGAARLLNFLNRDSANIKQHEALLTMVEDYARDTLTKPALWERGPETTQYLLGELSLLRGQPIDASADYFTDMQQEESATAFWRSAGLLLLAPRLDENVTKGANHLLKCPFSIHPSSLCVSIPFDLYEGVKLDRAEFEAVCISLDDLFAPSAKRKAVAHQRLSKAVAWFRWMHIDVDDPDVESNSV